MLNIKPRLKSKTTSNLITYLFIWAFLSFPISGWDCSREFILLMSVPPVSAK